MKKQLQKILSILCTCAMLLSYLPAPVYAGELLPEETYAAEEQPAEEQPAEEQPSEEPQEAGEEPREEEPAGEPSDGEEFQELQPAETQPVEEDQEDQLPEYPTVAVGKETGGILHRGETKGLNVQSGRYGDVRFILTLDLDPEAENTVRVTFDDREVFLARQDEDGHIYTFVRPFRKDENFIITLTAENETEYTFRSEMVPKETEEITKPEEAAEAEEPEETGEEAGKEQNEEPRVESTGETDQDETEETIPGETIPEETETPSADTEPEATNETEQSGTEEATEQPQETETVTESPEPAITAAVAPGESWSGVLKRKTDTILKLELTSSGTVHMLLEGRHVWASVRKDDEPVDSPQKQATDPETDRTVISWAADAGDYLISLGLNEEKAMMARVTVTFMDEQGYEEWVRLNTPEPEEEEEPEEEPAEEIRREYTCTVPGAQDIELTEILSTLGITEDTAEFIRGVESVSVSNPDLFSLTETETGWTFRAVKAPEAEENISIHMLNGNEYIITVAATGTTEISTEDDTAVISTVNDLFLPEEASASVEMIPDGQDQEVIEAVQDSSAETEEETAAYQAFSIELENVETAEYEGFDVTVNLEEDLAGKDFQLYLVQDGNATDITDTLQLNSETTEDGYENVTGFSFTTEEFAEFVLTYTLATYYTTFDGKTFEIDLNYDSKSGVPENAELRVREILPEDEEYETYYNQAVNTVGLPDNTEEENGTAQDCYARFFDIEIWANEQKIQPNNTVSVSIRLADLPEVSNEEITVVHFDEEEGPVVMATEATAEADVQFETNSFSVYGVVVMPAQPQGVTDLGGRTFTINQNGRYMTSTVYTSGNTSRFANSGNVNDAATWQFEATDVSGEYNIFTADREGNKQYINLNTHGDSYADAVLSNTAQAFTVSKNEDGTYTFTTTKKGKTFHLREISQGSGFTGDLNLENPAGLSLDFTQETISADKKYMVLVKDNGKYYIVNNDATLTEVDFVLSENPWSVVVEEPMMWTTERSGDNAHLYYNSEATGFQTNLIASDYYRRYLDPSIQEAWLQEQSSDASLDSYVTVTEDGTFTSEGETIHTNHINNPWDRVDVLNATNLKVNGDTISSNDGVYYLAIQRDAAGTPVRLKGGETDPNKAAHFAFAEAAKVPEGLHSVHSVDHIDLSISGTASVRVPYAYGKYYDKNGNEILSITDNTKVLLGEAQIYKADENDNPLEITAENIKRAVITAHDQNHNELHNVFYVSGYSQNAITEYSTSQIRIDGRFLVSDLRGTDFETLDDARYYGYGREVDTDYVRQVRDQRKANAIEYTVTVTKPVTFYLVHPENKDQVLYDSEGNIMTVTVDVAFSGSFNYWDKDKTEKNDGNECPPLQNNSDWEDGDIPNHNMSGMDFKLDGTADDTSPIVAVEIGKVILDNNGNRLDIKIPATYKFDIYENRQANRNGVAEVNVNAYSSEPDMSLYNGYNLLRTKTVTVNDEDYGFALTYDYNVTDAMYYIVERSDDELTKTVTDDNDRKWTFVKTYIETEYVRRGNNYDDKDQYPSPVHLTKDYTLETDGTNGFRSIPEVVGNFTNLKNEPKKETFLEFFVYNVYEPKKYPVYIKKTGDGNPNAETGLAGAEFDLYGPYTTEETGISGFNPKQTEKKINQASIVTTTSIVKVGDLSDGIYYLIETVAPTNHCLLEDPIIITVDSRAEMTNPVNVITSDEADHVYITEDAEGEELDEPYYQLNVVDTEITEISVTKTWDDAENQDGMRPQTVVFELYKNGAKVDGSEITLNGAADEGEAAFRETEAWKATWSELDKYANGTQINYTVQEVVVPDNYTVDYGKDGETVLTYASNGGTITNRHIPEMTSETITKAWEDGDNQDGIRPESVEVVLTGTAGTGYRVEYKVTLNGEADGTAPTTAGGYESAAWTATFVNLPRYYQGTLITYSYSETPTSVITGTDGPGTYAYSWNGNTVTNRHTPETITKTIVKAWDDRENQDGIRPGSVEVVLTGTTGTHTDVYKVTLNGEVDGTVPTTAAGVENSAWTATFVNLPKYYQGTLITYSYSETPTSVITGTDGAGTYAYSWNGNTVTNKHTPETITKTIVKAWDDGKNQDGIRPDSVEVMLTGTAGTDYRVEYKVTLNGEADGTAPTTAGGYESAAWTATFVNLPKYYQGTLITYSYSETPTSVITGADGAGTYAYSWNGNTVTNKHTPETIIKTIVKAWDDGENQDGIRPDSVEVMLTGTAGTDYRVEYKVTLDGTAETTVPTTADGYECAGWTAKFVNLPKYHEGTEITYRYLETPTDAITGTDGPGTYAYTWEGNTVTNKHTPETITKTIVKVWDDRENQDGIRPDNVEVVLTGTAGTDYRVEYRVTLDGTAETTVPTSVGGYESTGWTATFVNLPKYHDGTEIAYSYSETPTDVITGTDGPGTYAYIWEGNKVTNKHTPEKTSISVTKAWDDQENKCGVRPDSVTFALYADETLVKGSEIILNGVIDTEEKDFKETAAWVATWSNLSKYSYGFEISYTVKETSATDVCYSVSYGDETSTSVENGETITNSIKTTSLTIDKTIISPVPTDSDDKQFHFTVEVKKPNGTENGIPITGTYDSNLLDSNGNKITYTFIEGKTTVTTTGTQSITISGLPQGAIYTVTEATDPDFEVTEPEAGTVDNTYNQSDIDTTGNTYSQSGTLGEITATAGFLNTRKTGSLKITKSLQGKDGDAAPSEAKTYPIKVTTIIGDITYYVTYNETTGQYELTTTDTELSVTSGVPLTIDNLPVSNGGTALVYKVEEVNLDEVEIAGYTNVTVDNVTVESKDNITLGTDTAAGANLVNVYELTRLTISKAMNVGSSNEDFSFTVEVKKGETPYSGTAWLNKEKTDEKAITFDERGRYTATVRAGNSITIYGLPAGCSYTVKEQDKEGYLLVSVDGDTAKKESSGTISETESTAAFVNREVVDVSVDKAWLNSDGTALDWPDNAIVTVALMNGTTEVDTWNLDGTAEDHKHHTFANLDKYDAEGKEISYTVEETNVTFTDKNDYNVTVDNSTQNMFHITNELKPGALKVTKAVTVDSADLSGVTTGRKNLADGTYTFTITGPKNYSETRTITVTGGVVSDPVELTGLVPGEYVVTEAESTNGTTLSCRTSTGGTDSGDRGIKITVTPGSTTADHIASFTNNINTTTLTINKTIVSPVPTDSTDKEFTFSVKVTKPDGNPLTGTFGEYEFYTNGVTTVTTTGNDSKTIPDLPQGATYTITEATDDGYTQEAVFGASGTLSTTAATAAFTNTRKTGSLVITKELKGKDSDAAPSGTYTYPIHVTTKIGETTFYVAQSGNSYTLTTTVTTLNVTNGTPLTLTNLPISLTYNVEEVDPGSVNVAGYTNVNVSGTTKESVSDIAITETVAGQANLVNIYELTRLTISKTMDAGTSTEVFAFTVEVKDSEGVAYNGDAWLDAGKTQKITFVNGQYIASVQAGSSKTIFGLPAGYSYKITEQDKKGNLPVGNTESTGVIGNTTAAFVNQEVVNVSVDKTWKNSDGSDLAWPDGAIVTIALMNGTTQVKTCKLTGSNPVHTSHTFENLPKYDNQGNTITYTVTEANVTFTKKDDYTVAVTGNMTDGFHITNKLKPGALKVTKAVTVDGAGVSSDSTGKKYLADGTYSFTITGTKGYSETGSITVTGGMAATDGIVLENLVPGEYTITESVANNGTSLRERSGGTNSGDNGIIVTVAPGSTADANIAAFTNNINTTSLIINKTIVSPVPTDSTDKVFTFTVKVTKPDGNPLTGMFGGYEFDTNGETTVATTGNDSKTIQDLPQGATYTVTETANSDFDVTASSNVTGELGTTPSTVAFTNTRKTGSLEITKELRGKDDDEAPSGTYTYSIEVTTEIGGTTYYVAQSSGTYILTATKTQLSVKNSAENKLTLTNLPVSHNGQSLIYTVKEVNPGSVEIAGYTNVTVADTTKETVSTNPGTADNPGAANLVNVYERDKGGLSIAKTVTVNGGTVPDTDLVDGEYEFTVASDAGVSPKTTKTVKITITNGQIEKVVGGIKNNGKAVITDLPTGTYTVTEILTPDQADRKKISFTASNNTSVNVTKNNTNSIPTASFVNNIEVGSLKITKLVKIGNDVVTATNFDGDARKNLADGTYTFNVYTDSNTTESARKANGKAVGEVTVEIKDGVAKEAAEVTNLLPGKYYIKETGRSNSAVTMDPAVFEVTVEGGKAGDTVEAGATATATNKLPLGNLTITKRTYQTSDTAGSGYEPLSMTEPFPITVSVVLNGTRYYVQDSTGVLGLSAPDTSLAATPLTVSGGTHETTPVLNITNLPYGTYTVTESNPGHVTLDGYSYVNITGMSQPSTDTTVDANACSAELVNVYIQHAEWTPEIVKLLNDTNYSGSDFSFTISIKGENNEYTQVKTATLATKGTVPFKAIEYPATIFDANSNSKEYIYKITEEPNTNTDSNIVTDDTSIYAKVVVTKSTSSVLSATGTYYKDEACTQVLTTPTFRNYNTGGLTVTKETLQKEGDDYSALSVNKDFPVTISVVLDGTTYYVQGTNGTLNTTPPEPSLTVSTNQSLIISNLKHGNYVVTETNPAGVAVPNYTYVEVNGKSKDHGSATLGDTAQSPTVTLVNVYKRDKGSLSIAKTVAVNGSTIQNTKLVDGEYNFIVVSKETTGEGENQAPVTTKNVTIKIENGSISLVAGDGTLQDGKAVISNLPTGEYTVTENLTEEQKQFITGSVSGSSSATDSTEVTVSKDDVSGVSTASFVNDLKVGSLKITKKAMIGDKEASTLAEPMKSLADGTYPFQVYSNAEATTRATKADGTVIAPVTVEINDGSVEPAEVTDLLPGTYYVKETAGTNSAVMRDERAIQVTVTAGKTGSAVESSAIAEAVNTLPLGSLKVTKTIWSTTGETMTPNPTPEYPITITVTLDGTTYYVQDTNGNLVKTTDAQTSPSLKVTAGTDLAISNLPYGTYAVTETDPDNVAIEGYSYIDVTGTSHASATAEVNSITGTAGLVNVYVKDTEWKPQVSKQLNGMNYSGDDFSFTITEITDSGTGHSETINTTSNGTVSFTAIPYKLADKSKTFKYSIVETDQGDGNIAYDTTPIYAQVNVSYESGTLSATGKYYSDEACTKELTAPTIRNTELGSLKVTKTVTGAYTANGDTYPITVKSGDQYVTAEVSTDSETTYIYNGLSDTDPGYTIPAGVTLQFIKLPVGTYTVTEGSVSKTGYTITTTYQVNDADATSGTVTVTKGKTAKVGITNHYWDAELVITKTINGVTPDTAAAHITIKVTDNAGHVLLEELLTNTNVFTLTGNTYSATLKSTDNALIVPDGVYTVTETMTDLERYVLKSSTYAITAKKSTTSSIATSGTGYTLQLTDDPNHSTGRIDYTNTYAPAETPHKKETDPYEGTGSLGGVQVGDEITYEISFKNYKTDKATVIIKDILDTHVEPVSEGTTAGYEFDSNTRTLTWTRTNVPAGESGTVLLKVKVLESALTPGKVINKDATVKIGDDNEYTLETVENPVTEPHKQETVPYTGNGVLGAVKVGDRITYEITYKNYKAKAADIVVRDTLDPHVKFISASTNADAGGESVSYTISTNDAGAAVVCWTVKNVRAGDEGKVTLTVEVLESAMESKGGPGKVINNGETATVQVGNDKEITLETVENPVPEKPYKQETAPFKGNGTLGAVHVGDEITYEITYKNYKPGVVDIVITDTLDKNVSFVSASTDAAAAGGTVSYTQTTNTNQETVITWTVSSVQAGKEGKVTLTVKVLETALVSGGGPGKVDNGGSDATVQVGQDPAFELEYVENPVFEKRETSPYEGTGLLGYVKVGEVITYQISYKNYKTDVATVTVKDRLDANVELVRDGTTKGYTYDENTRTMTWIITNVPSGESGTVVLKVKALESALVSDGGPGKVLNEGASVQIGNDNAYTLETVENPVPEPPHKRETGISHNNTSLTAGYTGIGTLGNVQVGDLITYEISYVNYKTTAARVVITDKLDPHVAYVGSSNSGTHTDEAAGGTVTWTIDNVQAGTEGKVTLTVRVLDTALVSNSGTGKVVNGGSTATVKIGEDNAYELEEVENPIEEPPHKIEILPYEGNGVLGGVKVGDKITYEISYTNYKSTAVNVVIKDKLDTNVAFVEASNGGTPADGVVTWTIADVDAGRSGTVTLTVQVLPGALEENGGSGKVLNGGKTATVKVGDDHEFTLETVENPVPEPPHKKERVPYEGTGVLGNVQVGDIITYQISYTNYKTQPATVWIEDRLDERVDFVSADHDGKIENGVVTWSLASVPAGQSGIVTLKVKVRKEALVSNGGPGKVVNGGDTATVQVGTDSKFTLEVVENSVEEEPHKQEIVPYTGNGVLGSVDVGDRITYEISYTNYKPAAANVVIKDKLDTHAAFVEASNGGTLTNGVVTWTLVDVQAGRSGKVTLTVEVLESAKLSGGGPGKVVNNGGTATVKVGNDHEFTLETVENPVRDEPHKKETAPYEGNGVLGSVKVGDEITYEISYINYKTAAADVVIKDRLDKNVSFVSADHGGVLSDGVVTWALKDVAAGKSGKVALIVKVLEGAFISAGGPGKVVNNGDTATVKIGNDSEFTLETVENPVPEEPHKREILPYEGNGVLGPVHVGDEITYEINYLNYKAEAADIVIRDKLDTHVAFVEASNGGSLANGTVTWTLKNVAAGKAGKVTLTVKVLEDALVSGGGPGKVINNGDTATVKVGNDHEFTLDTVENPVDEEPHKQEIVPYTGIGVLGLVKVGDRISYEISYTNYKTESADVVIRDRLDRNVAFVSADHGGTLADGIVTWTLKNVAAGKSGKVTLTVKVLEGAMASAGGPGKVVNNGETATVKIGNDHELTLESVENPVGEEPHKQEVSPYEGNGVLGPVKVGDQITYEISYVNYKAEAADVVIRDRLDGNVDFVSADQDGVLKDGVVTWILKNVPAGTRGKVILTVEVLAGALVSFGGPGKVVNGGDTATVKVGNDHEFTLETVENPVGLEPHKKEISPYIGNGKLGGVGVGEDITYRIKFTNYKAEAATVIIQDKLDPDVEFIFASRAGAYDKETHTVNWTITSVPAGKEDFVTLIVRVRSSVLVSNGGDGMIVNGGESTTVKVGNDQAFTVELVKNPVPVVSVTVRKVWNDNNDAAGLRPASMKVVLSNGAVYTLNPGNNWTVTVKNLPKYVHGKLAEYTWTEKTVMGYVLESETHSGNVTTFTNKPWTRLEKPKQGKKPKLPGSPAYFLEDYGVPLGIGVIINHVGDCFD